jgi:IS30 family transposase
MIHKQLNQEERYQIFVLLKAGHIQNEIGQLLERSDAAMERLNNRPRKRPGYLTHNQAFFKSGVELQT